MYWSGIRNCLSNIFWIVSNDASGPKPWPFPEMGHSNFFSPNGQNVLSIVCYLKDKYHILTPE